MTLHEHVIKKLYFSISELSDALWVEKSTIRFWEDQFKLKIYRNRGGDRRYTINDVGQIATISKLVKHFHISAARNILEKGNAEALLSILEPGIKEPKVIDPKQEYQRNYFRKINADPILLERRRERVRQNKKAKKELGI